MTPLRYIRGSLAHYRFTYAGVLAGAVLGATVLLGALFAGDSVKATLRRIAENRTGRATHLLAAGDRFFREQLADDLARAAKARVAPVVYARGTATQPGSNATAGGVQLVGVTGRFWQFAPVASAAPLADQPGTLAVNDTLAGRLALKVGDLLVVRVQKPGILAGNAPIAGADDSIETLRGTIAAIVGDDAFGRFSLESSQVPAPSVFLPIATLQEALEQPARANLLLIDAADSNADLGRALSETVRPGDYGLTLKWLERAGTFELTSSRIFIDPEIAATIARAVPAAQPVISYLVNEFRVRDRAAPYALATATTPAAAPFLPADLGAREIVLNSWLAEDLQARVGDEVKLTFFQTGASSTLVERDAAFRVRAIVPLEGLAADRAWMPEFPGISNAEDQSAWDPGLPIDLKRIRDKDEKYWDEHRGAPKAFLALAAGCELWSTRWGNFTALRIPFERARAAELETTLLRALRPEMNQMQLRDFRASAQDAAQSPVDFGGLFAGMSFFLIVAALALVAMLFQFALLQRNREAALLGAVGVPAKKLLRWRLAEGAVILVAGSVLGGLLAALYTRAILRLLASIWAGAGAGETFRFAAAPASIAAGGGIFVALSLLAIWLAIRKQTSRALSIRLAASAEEITPTAKVRRSSAIIACLALVIGAGAIGMSGRGLPAQAAYFVAGFALLLAGISLCRLWMAGSPARERRDGPQGAGAVPPLTRRATREAAVEYFDASHLGMLNLKARRSRSLTVIGLIATAVFMVLSVAAFRKHAGDGWLKRDSGTGGFALWMETTSALNPPRDGRTTTFEIFERHAAELDAVVPLRVGTGDNADCFNLNSTAQPRLLAVDAPRLAERSAFHLKLPAGSGAAGWNALRTGTTDGALPAFVDETTLLWALKRKVGDVLTYTDEHGRPFAVQIAGTVTDSIFQGHVLVDEQAFLQKFPSNAGYSVFLIDARDPAGAVALRDRLAAVARDAGARVELTRDVLAAFHGIENTYIAIFNVLGSLGVILGSLGLTIVVARNVRERRGELAAMLAMGIPRGVLARMVFSEFGRLVFLGIALGAVAALVAVWPSLTTLPPVSTVALVVGLLVGIVGLNLASGWLVWRWSLREIHASRAHTAL